MTDDSGRRKQKKELEDAQRELARLDEEKRRRQERRLNLEEELPTKSKILRRPLIEELPGRGKKTSPGEACQAAPQDGKKAPAGLVADKTKPSAAPPGRQPSVVTEPADASVFAGHAGHHAGGHIGGGHGGVGVHGSGHSDSFSGISESAGGHFGGGHGGVGGHDSSAGHGHSESSVGISDATGDHGGDGHGGDGHGGGHGGDGGGGDGGGHGHITGVSRARPQAPMQAASIWGLMKEAFIRRRDSGLARKGAETGVTLSDLSSRMWGFTRLNEVMEERMVDDLRRIESSSRERLTRIGGLNAKKSNGGLTYEENKELRRLEDTEATRYWLREKFLRAVPLEKQDDYDWVQPIGKGAFGVMPYTVITTWDLMNMNQRAAVRWQADNILLRWQTAGGGLYLPRKPSMKWFQEKAKKGIETLFDDWNEEIYSDKAWRAMVKKGHAELEKIEEELTGYDQFTVAEEKKIASILSAYLKRQDALSKEPLYYD